MICARGADDDNNATLRIVEYVQRACVCVAGECVSFGAEKYAIASKRDRAIRRVRVREGAEGRKRIGRTLSVAAKAALI